MLAWLIGERGPRFTVQEIACHGPNVVINANRLRAASVHVLVLIDQTTGHIKLVNPCPRECEGFCLLNRGRRDPEDCHFRKPPLTEGLGIDSD